VVLRIDRADMLGSVIFVLSGRLELQHIGELQAQFTAQRTPIIVDLRDVRLVDREVIETLAHWELDGVKLENCPAYLRDWIARVRCQK
jgi:anti-anti-sigma regulatory factor